MKSHKLTIDLLKRFHQLENIALVLDESIEADDIDNEKIEKTQKLLDQFADLLIDEKSLDPRTYILYEIQALLHYMRNDKTQAKEFIKTARLIKGDNGLFTVIGRKLLKSSQNEIDSSLTNDTKKVMPNTMRIFYFLIVVFFSLLGLLVLIFDKRYDEKEKWQIGAPALMISVVLVFSLRRVLFG